MKIVDACFISGSKCPEESPATKPSDGIERCLVFGVDPELVVTSPGPTPSRSVAKSVLQANQVLFAQPPDMLAAIDE